MDVLIERVSTRTTNPYGNTEAEQSLIRQQVFDIKPLLRQGATLELDGRRPVSDLAQEIELLLRPNLA